MPSLADIRQNMALYGILRLGERPAGRQALGRWGFGVGGRGGWIHPGLWARVRLPLYLPQGPPGGHTLKPGRPSTC